MVKLSTRGSWFSNYDARATRQIIYKSKIDSEQMLRAMATGDVYSQIVQMKPNGQILFSKYGQGTNRAMAEYKAASSFETFQSLLPGSKFIDVDIALNIKKNSAIIFLIGKPRSDYHKETDELFHGLVSAGIEATLLLNVKPLDMNETQPALPTEEGGDEFPISNRGFLTTYAIFLTNDNPDILDNQINTVVAQLNRVYDSERSQLSAIIKYGRKANEILRNLIWGKLSYGTILTLREAVSYWQAPPIYGVEEIVSPDVYVPTSTSFQNANGIQIGIVLGQFDEEIVPAFFNPETIFQNMAIWGTIGYGKSTFIYHMVTKLHNHRNIGILILDFHNEYRKIVSALSGNLSKDILVLNPHLNHISFNPLEFPPGLTGKEREIAITENVENFLHTLKSQLDWVIGEVQDQRCRKHLYEIYETSNCPTIGQLVKLLEKDKLTMIKKDEDNLPLKLSKFSTGPYGDIFNHPHTNLPFELFETSTVIFELGKWPVELRSFFATVLLNRWWTFRIAQNSQAIKPHVLVLDEFHHYDNLPIIRKMLSEGRKYKQGVICSHQGPFQITDKALLGDLVRNTVTKVVFRQTLRQDIEIILGSLGLHDMKWRDYMTRMKLGEAVVTLYGISQPFKIMTQPFPTTTAISDDTIKEKHEPLLQVLQQEEVTVESGLGTQEKEFLQLVHENEFSTASAIINQMRIMRSEGYKIKSQLVEEGLVTEEDIRTGKGRPKKILKLTDEGYNLLGVEKEGAPAHYGGDEHRYMIEQVAGLLSGKGWRVVIEADGCDVKAMYPDGKKIAVEVETCKEFNQEQIIKNIQRDLMWAEKVVILNPNEETKGRIQRLAQDNGIEKVVLMTYADVPERLLEVV